MAAHRISTSSVRPRRHAARTRAPMAARTVLSPLAQAALLAATALCAAPGTAMAQGAGAGAGAGTGTGAGAAAPAHVQFDIPAGTLDQALSRFGRQAGVQIAVNAELTAGLRSPGVSGSHTVAEALQLLLAGTGLQAARDAGGEYTLRKATAAAASLPAVKVSAKALQDGVTEGTGSYTTSAMSTATKLPLSVRETPQTVTVITRAQLTDQAVSKASEVFTNAPGITVTSASGPNRELYYSRGFEVENYTFDGHPVTLAITGGQVLFGDMAMYDRVEIVRGAPGLTQGAGSPSAAVNFVRKRPTREFQASVEGQLGSWNHLGLQADVSGPVNEAGTLRGRAVALWRDADSYQDTAYDKRKLIYVVGEADLTPDTLFTLALSHQESDSNVTWAGLPTALDGSDLKLPRSTFLGNKWGYWNDVNSSLYASLEQGFANGWKASLSTNLIWGTQERYTNGILLNGTQWDQTGGRVGHLNHRKNLDINVQGPYRLLDREHKLAVGMNARTSWESADGAGYWFPIDLGRDIDIWNWTHDATKVDAPDDFHSRERERQHGIYGSTQLNLADPLKLILGLRVDWYKFHSTMTYFDSATWLLNDPESMTANSHLTKYAGILYDVDRQHTVYASYTDIFRPQGAKDKNGDYLKPVIGKNFELGAKAAYLGGTLNLDAALFRIDQENLAMTDPACHPGAVDLPPNCSRPAGLTRSQGFDIDIHGTLAEGWEISGGYSFANVKIRKNDDPLLVGTRVRSDLPTRLLKLTTTYRLPGNTWRIGGSVRWQNDVHHHDDWMGYDYDTRQESFAVFDAMLGYRYDDRLDFQLNVSNLFDKVYYRVINTQPVEWGGNAMYGAPRRLLLSARYKF